MKTPTRLLLLGLCATSFLCLQTVRADDTSTPPEPPPGRMHMLPPGFDQLNLTDAQKAAIKQIMEETRQKIDQVLTPEQKTKLEQLKAAHHRGEGGNPPPPPPGN